MGPLSCLIATQRLKRQTFFTKGFTNPESWEHAYTLIGMVDGKTVRRILGVKGGVSTSRGASERRESKSPPDKQSKGGYQTQKTTGKAVPTNKTTISRMPIVASRRPLLPAGVHVLLAAI